MRVWCMVPPPAERLTRANGSRPAPTGPPPPGGPIRGGIRGVIGGPIRGESRGREIAIERPGGRLGIAGCNRAAGRVPGPKSASARPGPCTRPRSADALTRREDHPARQTPASRSFVLGRRRRPAGTVRGGVGGLRALHLDPGSGRIVPVTRVGRSALRAAAPAGRGRCRLAPASRSGPRDRHKDSNSHARHRLVDVPERAVPAGQGSRPRSASSASRASSQAA
jgi:hypothetical protein